MCCPRYYATLYRRAGVPRDYFFLFDLMASGWKFSSFEELLRNAAPDTRQHVLSFLSSACWHGLHAPPPMDANSLLTSNPIMRLLIVLMAYDDFQAGRNKRSFASFVDLATALDKSEQPRSWGCRPIEDILGFCRRMVKMMLQLNEQNTWNPEMRRHFNHILELMDGQLAARNDYTSYIGMPDHGNPFFGMDNSEDRRLLDNYEPPEEVVNWFSFRNNLLFKFRPREEIIDKMEKHFGMDELFINCPCGFLILGRVSRYQEQVHTKCPNCHRAHNIDRDDTIKIRMSDTSKDKM